ncbi:Nif3-like dinuclear metal center hexameric protein [Buchnera aphidicola (Mindarus keteleerifoliae)]|uniref:Nif3-like dinuclear metal center hexameric protein n=1 Tax=Buchnera aphidicola TaxID=9 RepID=UPI0031B6B7BE
MLNMTLEKIINKELNSKNIKDYVPNGLQIEGKKNITKIITGVTACQELLNLAVKKNADAIIVHHGFFWFSEFKSITGILKKRIKTLITNDINLYSWHLPLDMHMRMGNNRQIANKLKIEILGKILPILPWGKFKKRVTGEELTKKIIKKYKRVPFYYGPSKNKNIKSIAWCSGRGQKFLQEAVNFGVDAFLTGEMSEETLHFVKENKIHFFSIGHHASEIDGIKSLTKWLKKNYNFDTEFININNPV